LESAALLEHIKFAVATAPIPYSVQLPPQAAAVVALVIPLRPVKSTVQMVDREVVVMEKLEPLAQETPHPFRQVKEMPEVMGLVVLFQMLDQVVVVVQVQSEQEELVLAAVMAAAPQRHLFQDHQLITQVAAVAAVMLAVA
jgi:hypothetical protein